ncbi:MAG: T9SS type A sorting domain-containing protein [Candidatus Kryptoniota bacterium]
MINKNAILFILVFSLASRASIGQWSKTVLPPPPYGHGALPGRVTTLASDGLNLYAGTLGGNLYRSSDNGTTWTCIDSGLTTSDITTIHVINNILLVGAYGNIANATYGMHGQGSGIYMTSDVGRTWKKVSAGIPDTNIYVISHMDSTIFAGTWNAGIYYSEDIGKSWNQANNGLTNLSIRTIAAVGNRLYAGTWGGGVFISDDHGGSWAQSNTGINNLYVNSIAIDSPYVYMGNTEGVYKSTNGGFSWNLTNKGLTTTYINTFLVIHPDVMVGTSGSGLFVSLNQGSSWQLADTTGLTDGYIYCLAVNGSRLFAGANNGEVWSRPLKEIITKVMENWEGAIANSFQLYQNYPNPFNPETRISYKLSSPQKVILNVYDELGKQIATLASGVQAPGVHEIIFDGSDYPSGVYFYQLKVGDYVSTKKMTLIK